MYVQRLRNNGLTSQMLVQCSSDADHQFLQAQSGLDGMSIAVLIDMRIENYQFVCLIV